MFEASKRDVCVSMPNTIMLTLLKTDIVSSCVRAKLTSVKYRVSRCAIGISNNEVCHYLSQAVKTVVIWNRLVSDYVTRKDTTVSETFLHLTLAPYCMNWIKNKTNFVLLAVCPNSHIRHNSYKFQHFYFVIIREIQRLQLKLDTSL